MQSSLEVCIKSLRKCCGSTIRLDLLYPMFISHERDKKLGRSFDWSVGRLHGSIQLAS